jgi:hypothetical protein
MMPSPTETNRIHAPLDLILGTKSNVRILRVLTSKPNTPLGVPYIAQLAGLNTSGTRRSLERLASAGIVVRIGQGRTLQYDLRENDPIVPALRALFSQEQERYDHLINSLQQVLYPIREISKAWIEELPTVTVEPLHLTAVVEVMAIEWIREELRSRLAVLEKEFGITIEVAIFTCADAPPPKPKSVSLISEDRIKVKPRYKDSTHEEKDKRSLHLSKGIAEMIRDDPFLITRAKQHLKRLMQHNQGNASGDISEWRQILDTYSPDRIRDLLASESSRATRLRQSSPFFAVLTPDELAELMVSN